MQLTVKQASRIANIPIDSLRYYDKLGIVVPQRGENGYRFYTEKNITALKYVYIMKQASFTLAEIKQAVLLLDSKGSAEFKVEAKKALREKTAQLQQQVSQYQQIIALLEGLNELMDETEVGCANQTQISALVSSFKNPQTPSK